MPLLILVFLFSMFLPACIMKAKKQSGQPLECTLNLPQKVVANTLLTFRMTLINRAGKAIELGLGGNPPSRFSVTTEADVLVWESTGGNPIQQLLELRTLAPGDSIVFTREWNLTDSTGTPVQRGTYTVHGWVELDPPFTARADPARLTIE